MDYPIRPAAPEEMPKLFRTIAVAFGNEYRGDEAVQTTLSYADLDRSISVWDGDQVVGTAGTWNFELSVPGGFVPCGGLTWVSVLPSHRRQGILSAMMRRQLDDVRDHGEPIAALWASEAIIYGRFGYGHAADGVESLTIERAHAALRYAAPFSGRTRYVEREEALEKWPAIWDAVRSGTPGMHNRTPAWWENRLFRQPPWPSPPGYSGLFCVQYEEAGRPLGFLRYRVKGDYENGVAAGTLEVESLLATSEPAYSALWQHVFGVDLIKTIEARWRPVDEPLQYMLADTRRLLRRPTDTLWVRMMDIPRALEARRFASEGKLVLEVSDSFCPAVGGRFLLEGGPDGARCTPTTQDADLALTSAEVGALYLGGTSAHTLARAGRIEGSERAVARAAAMFAWSPRPWAPEIW